MSKRPSESEDGGRKRSKIDIDLDEDNVFTIMLKTLCPDVQSLRQYAEQHGLQQDPDVRQLLQHYELPAELNDDNDEMFCQALDEAEENQLLLQALAEEELRQRNMQGGGDQLLPMAPAPAAIQRPEQEPVPAAHAQEQIPAPAPVPAPAPAPAPEPAPAPAPVQPPGNVQDALNGAATVTTYHPVNNQDLLAAFHECEDNIRNDLVDHIPVKYYIAVEVRYSKTLPDGETVTIETVFHSETVRLLNNAEIDDQIAHHFHMLNSQAEDFQENGSGWIIERVIAITLHHVPYEPLAGNSYIPSPKFIADKKAVLNIQNEDNKCVLWSILAYLHPRTYAQHPYRARNYLEYEHEINMQGVSFPTPLTDICKIETNNNISVNVFGYDKDDGVFPLRISKDMKDKHINLLLLAEGDKRHYCLIRDFSRLMGQRTKHHGQAFYCYNCLHGFTRNDLLQNHVELCYKKKTTKVVYPEEGSSIKFEHFKKQLQAPFIIYADFECYTTKIATCSNDPKQSSTEAYQRHEPSSFSCMTVCADDAHSTAPVVYRSENVVEALYEHLMKEEKRIRNILKQPKEMVMTEEDKEQFTAATVCHICEKSLEGETPVRDHDHLTGKFRGAAHNQCNLQYTFTAFQDKTAEKEPGKKKDQFVIPVVFHNLRGYDAHLLMAAVGQYKHRRLQCIPNNKERYISFSCGSLRFIDSYQFMNTSLEKLVSNLAQEGYAKFKLLTTYVTDPEQQELLMRKGVYPYDYVDSPARLQEASLPPKPAFYSRLNEEPISDSDYAHAQKVWNVFNCQTLGDYHDLYLQSDVLLLADVFEHFRATALNTYKLDPAHYFTSPGLAWDAMLRYTDVELQLLHDPDMYLMIESGIRGGISVITKKWAKANNPSMDDYNESEPTSYNMYLDANNLYGWAMSQPMPVDSFEWMSEDELKGLDVTSLSDTADEGYIFEVDLDYPPEIHDEHSDYPLAPETKAIPREKLSPMSQKLIEKLDIKGKPQPKLMTTLEDKSKYVLHYVNLKLYLRLGMKLKKIHRGVRFRQTTWLKAYISLNTEKRKQAKNAFEKDFFKLMNNAIFGKTMENVRNHVNYELVHTEKRMKKSGIKTTVPQVLYPERRFDHCALAADKGEFQQADICRLQHSRCQQNSDVCVPLRLHQSKVWLTSGTVFHRHRLTLVQHPDGRCLQRHGSRPRLV